MTHADELSTRETGERRSVLRSRDFRLLWFGETTSVVGSNISKVALPLVALTSLRSSAFQVSALAAATWVPWLVIGLPAGAWVDRLPRRRLMQACNGVSSIALLSVPISAWTGALTIGQLFAVALSTGAANVFFQTAYQVYLPAVVGSGDLTTANATLQGSASVAQIAGPGLAGLLAQLAGAVSGLVADAASFLVSTACLARIEARGTPSQTQLRSKGLRGQVVDGVRFVRADPYLRVLTVYGACANLALAGYQSILVVFLIRDVDLDPGTAGILISGMSVGGVLGAASSHRVGRAFGTARAVLGCELLGAPFALLVPLTVRGAGLTCLVVGGVGVGAGVVAGNVIISSFRQTYIPREFLGRVIVTMQFLNYGAIPLGALLAGALATSLGSRFTLWVMATALILASFILLIGPIRHQRNLPAHCLPSR